MSATHETKTTHATAPAPAPEAPAPRVPGRGGAQDVAAGALATPASTLPYADQIQKAFGRHSIASVRARVGGAATEAAHQLGAPGFAYGEDIVLRDNPGLHVVAHEAAHVIQQRGSCRITGLGAAGDEHEQHAEEVAHAVERGESAEKLLDRYSPGAAVTSPTAVQLFAGAKPFTDYGAITKHSMWLIKADAYEKRIGVHAYNHGLSSAVLTVALDRMQAVLMQHFTVEETDRDEKRKLYKEAFTKDDPGSAGQIGTDARLKTIMEMLRTGNLRERMTAFYNAAYYNTAGKKPQDTVGRGFKQIATEVICNGQADTAHDLGLAEDKMQKQAEFQDGWWRWGAQMLSGGLDLLGGKVGYNFAADPFALGNLALSQETKGAGEIGTSQWGRTPRTQAEQENRKHTVKQYADMAMPLSTRELASAKAGTPGFKADPEKAKVPWASGHAYYAMPESHWVTSVRDTLHMPVIAGVSGTTTRMLSAFQWLNTGAEALHFRLALMGWMLPIGDHSLYEILRGAQLAGVANPDEGDLGDVVRMYMNVAPLSTTELRTHAGKDNMFPHEEIYLAKSQAGADTPGGFLGVGATNKFAAGKAPAGADAGFTEAHATAVYTYTSGMHMIMNAILETKRLPKQAAHRMVQGKLMAVVDYWGRRTYLENKQALGPLPVPEATELTALQNQGGVELIDAIKGEFSEWRKQLGDATKSPSEIAAYRTGTVEVWMATHMPRLYEELVAHTNMTVEGLTHLPPVPKQTVWRGDWQNALWGYAKGSRIPIHVLRSFSTKRTTAEGFMSEGKLSTKVLLEVETKVGGAGRDVKHLSAIPSEAEVLFPPGTTLVVTDIEQKAGYTLLRCAEE